MPYNDKLAADLTKTPMLMNSFTITTFNFTPPTNSWVQNRRPDQHQIRDQNEELEQVASASRSRNRTTGRKTTRFLGCFRSSTIRGRNLIAEDFCAIPGRCRSNPGTSRNIGGAAKGVGSCPRPGKQLGEGATRCHGF